MGLTTIEEFDIRQGVRQVGIISIDFNKVNGNTLSPLFQEVRIGEMRRATPAYADDIAVVIPNTDTLKSLIHTSADYDSMEIFDFQLVKSVVLEVDPDNDDDDYVWALNCETMPVVTENMHVYVLRSAYTESSAVNENIKKDPIQPYVV